MPQFTTGVAKPLIQIEPGNIEHHSISLNSLIIHVCIAGTSSFASITAWHDLLFNTLATSCSDSSDDDSDTNECVISDINDCITSDTNECITSDTNECVTSDTNECVTSDTNVLITSDTNKCVTSGTNEWPPVTPVVLIASPSKQASLCQQ